MNAFKSFISSTLGKHVILVLGICLLILTIDLGAGRFAKGKATTWLCQYDTDVDTECADLIESVTSNTTTLATNHNANLNTTNNGAANVNANSASTSTSANQNSNNSEPHNNGGSQNSNMASDGDRASQAPADHGPAVILPDQTKRLAAQFNQVKNLVRHHGAVMAFFYVAYYSSISVLLFAGVIVALTLFLIAQDGWKLTNEYVKTVFVVAAAVAAFYGLWPPVFEIDKNISDNKALFLEYKTLENEILSYPQTHTDLKNQVKSPNDFINYVDSEMARLGNIAIGFDYTKINYKGAFESNKNSNTNPAAGNSNNDNTTTNSNNRSPKQPR